jgi:hypothetical protein
MIDAKDGAGDGAWIISGDSTRIQTEGGVRIEMGDGASSAWI